MDGVRRWIGEGKAASSIKGDWAGGCEARAGGWERRGVEKAFLVGPLQNVTSHALLGEPGPGNHKTAPLTSRRQILEIWWVGPKTGPKLLRFHKNLN